MTTPSVPRCGRMDDHDPHEMPAWPYWGNDQRNLRCNGHVVTEGAQPCVSCQRPVASCRCAEQRAEERNDEWWSE